MSINTISPTHTYKGTIPELAKNGELLEENRSEKITVDYYSDYPNCQNPYEYHSMTLNLGNKLRLKERDFQIVTATMYDGSTAYIDGSNAPYENRIYGFYDENQGQRRMKEYTIERFDEGGGLVFSKTFYDQNVPICQDVDELNESVCANLAEGVNVIRDKTFYGTVLKPNKKPWEKAAIVIPEGVESIERLVLGKWRYVSSLVLPDSLKVWHYAIDEVRGHLGRGALEEYNGCLYIGTTANPYFVCVGVKKSAGETAEAHRDTKYISLFYYLPKKCKKFVLPNGLLGIISKPSKKMVYNGDNPGVKERLAILDKPKAPADSEPIEFDEWWSKKAANSPGARKAPAFLVAVKFPRTSAKNQSNRGS